MASSNTTYQKAWDDNEHVKEGRDGRLRVSAGRWVYEVRIDGEYVDNFETLREVKRAYPGAVRRKD